jgi:uncharacterized protein YbjQ (UPF0145 family)
MQLPVLNPSHRISAKVGPWIDQGFDKYLPGENVVWESGLLPTPNGLTYAVVVWMPSLVMGEFVQGSFVLHDPVNETAEQMDRTIAEFVRQMKEARSQALSQANGEATGKPEGSIIDLARRAGT